MGEYYFPVLFTQYDIKEKAAWGVRDVYHVDGTKERRYCNYTLESHEKVRWYYSHKYNVEWLDSEGHKCSTTIGLKIMEHSYFGNKMVNQVMYDLMRNSAKNHSVSRIIWMSDYAMSADPSDRFEDGEYDRIRMCKVAQALPSGWLDQLQVKADNEEKSKAALAPVGYIVNKDKDQWITVYNNHLDGDPSTEEYWNKNINPLPLLTQFNEGGGGNYRGSNMDLLGTWALDNLKYTTVRPSGFDEEACLDNVFKEN